MPVARRKVSDNVWGYISHVIIPRLETPLVWNGRVRKVFPIQEDVVRPLLQLYKLDEDWFLVLLSRLPMTILPFTVDNPDLHEYIIIPAHDVHGKPSAMRKYRKAATDPAVVTSWVGDIVLRTLEGVLLIMDAPVQEKWELAEVEDYPGNVDPEMHLVPGQHLFWYTAPNAEQKPVIACFSFAPWEVTDEDMHDFARSYRFNPDKYKGLNGVDPTLQRNEKLWYYLCDQLIRMELRWFVVTNAKYWVFGVFGKGWKNVYFTGAYRHDSHTPTVMNILLYWVRSSVGENRTGRGQTLPLQSLEAKTANSVDGDSLAGDLLLNEAEDSASEAETELDVNASPRRVYENVEPRLRNLRRKPRDTTPTPEPRSRRALNSIYLNVPN